MLVACTPSADFDLHARCNCAMSKVRDLVVALSYGGAQSPASAVTDLGASFFERSFLRGPR